MPWQSIIRWGAYPVLVLGGATVIIAAQAAGAGYWPVVPLAVGVAAVAVWILERWLPFTRAWTLDNGEGRLDLAHLVGNIALGQITIALFAALCANVAETPAT